MKTSVLLVGLSLAAFALMTVPAASALEDPPQCIRQGPPCGPEPVCIVGDESTCLVATDGAAAPCVLGDRTCLVGIEWVVCVTEPCDPATVCVGYGRVCTPLGLP